ncbi:MAG: tRNA 2-thiouridine(34) synthase MnmA [Spirochaetales bacterium]|nr:tRNA 2-thiouridine(34) synthase MnmA [Spirochaetales bacterium]
MKIAVLLSGGVDSSCALLSVKERYPDAQITAYYLKIWLEDELASLGQCPWEEDLSYARGVCDVAKVPLKVVSLQREYWDKVVSYTVSELKAGRTPSPDIFCNRRIKFGAFLDRVGESFDKVASGHYGMIEEGQDGLYRLRRSPDPVKDQTYFLSHLTQEQAALALFPIGGMMKEEVRELARRWDLPTQDRKDSQGICFLGKIKYSDFVRHYMGEQEGPILEAGTNQELGRHKGTWFYTIGQRSGLGLSGGPWYVVGRDRERNAVIVAGTPAAIASAKKDFVVVNPNWIAEKPEPGSVVIKLRHGPKLIPASIAPLEEGENGEERWSVSMEESDRGLAPGQFSVFYHDEICLGGAMISEEGLSLSGV